ncbi:S-adenosyl-L-homocysteine hydrolase-like protein, partial [Aureobasidium melanogenum]
MSLLKGPSTGRPRYSAWTSVEKSDLLVEDLGEDVDTNGHDTVLELTNTLTLASASELDVLLAESLVTSLEQHDLGKDLVGEGAGHDEGRVAGGTAKVDKTTLGEEDDVTAGRHEETVNLGLDVLDRGGVLLQPGNVDLNVEVTNVADNGVLGHGLEVLANENVTAAGGGDEDLTNGSGLLHGGDLVTRDGGLESVDGVDLSNENAGTHGVEGLGATLTDITETSDNGDLTSDHDIGGTLDTVDKRLTAAVKVVELGLGDGVVDVDGGDEEGLVLEHLVEVVDTSGGLLGDTVAVLEHLRVLLVDESGKITTVIEDQVEGLARGESGELLLETPLVLLLGLTLPGEDGGTTSGNGGSGVVLGGEDVAGGPGELGTEGLEDLGRDGVLMCKQPAIRAPLRGCSSAYFARVAMRPGISCSASSISRRPKAAKLRSATLNFWAGALMVMVATNKKWPHPSPNLDNCPFGSVFSWSTLRRVPFLCVVLTSFICTSATVSLPPGYHQRSFVICRSSGAARALEELRIAVAAATVVVAAAKGGAFAHESRQYRQQLHPAPKPLSASCELRPETFRPLERACGASHGLPYLSKHHEQHESWRLWQGRLLAAPCLAYAYDEHRHRCCCSTNSRCVRRGCCLRQRGRPHLHQHQRRGLGYDHDRAGRRRGCLYLIEQSWTKESAYDVILNVHGHRWPCQLLPELLQLQASRAHQRHRLGHHDHATGFCHGRQRLNESDCESGHTGHP